MTTFAEAVQAAIPEADDRTVDYVTFCRTSFPFGNVGVREVYRAAARVRRADEKGLRLCVWCNRLAEPPDDTCPTCAKAMALP